MIHKKKQQKITSFVYKGFKVQIIKTGYFYPNQYEWILIPMASSLKYKIHLLFGKKQLTDISSTDSIKFCKRDSRYFIGNLKTNARSNIIFQRLIRENDF